VVYLVDEAAGAGQDESYDTYSQDKGIQERVADNIAFAPAQEFVPHLDVREQYRQDTYRGKYGHH
jgi:hypothetical protein